MKVTKLFVKRQHGGDLASVDTVGHDKNGLHGNVACAPFRQALIAAQSVTTECGLAPGDLRENIVVDFDQLYDLPSGTVVKIGEAMIRLTFHCEPCKKILKLVEFDRIVHRRGVFGCFLNSGTIALGDRFVITDLSYEPIPYAVNERIRWLLKNQDLSAAVTDLIHKVGLPASCTKLMSRFLQKQSLDSHLGEQTSGERLQQLT